MSPIARACGAAIGLALALLAGGCERRDQGAELTAAPPPASASASADASPLRSHCVGRFMLDLPDHFELSLGGDIELIYGLGSDFRKVTLRARRVQGQQPSLAQLAQQRAGELTARHHFQAAQHHMLAEQQRADDGSVLLRSYVDPNLLEDFLAELYVEREQAVGVLAENIYAGERPDAVAARLRRVAQGLRFAAEPAQAGRGTCLGPLVVDAAQDGEVLGLSFRSSRWPDVKLRVYANSLTTERDAGLLARWDDKSATLGRMGLSLQTLRRGALTLGAMPAEELLTAGKEDDKLRRDFSAESKPDKTSLATPVLKIDLSMGGPVDHAPRDPSLDERAALALWAAVLQSVRLRPGAV